VIPFRSQAIGAAAAPVSQDAVASPMLQQHYS